MNFGKDIDMVTYKQMGYTQKQVKNAQEYSKRNKIDMFEALQRLQQADRQMEEKKSTPPTHSYMKPLKNVKVQDYEVIYSKYVTHHSQLSREEIREVDNPVGLLNVSNCCYLNSLLQCYFLMGSFVRQILAAEPLSQPPHKEPVVVKRIKSQYGLLQSFKQIFSRLALSSKKYLNPLPVLKNLVDSVGERIQYGDEKDLHEINMCIVERLSECLMFTKIYFFKSHQEVSQAKKIQRENIKKLFYGTRVEYMEGSDDKLETQFMGIILNPGHSNIMSALDNEFHFQVEVKEGKMAKKSIFMKQIPQYLFFNISRAQFQQGGKQLYKNSEKMSFDFTIYLDRYMDKYREKGIGINPLILDLTKQKNTLSRKLNYLEILTNKLDECRQYANCLEGWTEKLPLKQDLLSQKQQYRLQIEKIEENLSKIESREEKYVLMYIFVHRGDATSGHYWGYGRNGNDWYKYDINVARIKEADIIVDIEKSRAIPYALVYAQEKSLESFEYPYHLDFTENTQLLGIQDNKGYEEQIPHDIRKQIIMENKQLHEFMALKKSQDLLESLQKQYKIRYNLVKSECEQYKKKKYRVSLTSNFACYLNCEGEEELMKYNIFSTSLWSLSQATPQQLAQDSALFPKIQKAFKKKIKGKMSLQYYLIGQEAPSYNAYRDYKMKYLLEKRYIKFINYLHSYMNKWPKIPLREESLLLIMNTFKKGPSLYLKNLIQQLFSIILIDLAKRKQPIERDLIVRLQQKSPIIKQQIHHLTSILKNQKQFQKPEFLGAEFEKTWSIEDLKKNKDDHDIFSKLKQILASLKQAYEIYRINTKEKKVVGKNQEESLI